MIEMVGEVRDKNAIIVDDIISTGGTLFEAANMLLERGAKGSLCLRCARTAGRAHGGTDSGEQNTPPGSDKLNSSYRGPKG